MKKVNFKVSIVLILLSIVTPFFANMLIHIVSNKNALNEQPTVISSVLNYQNDLGLTPYSIEDVTYSASNYATANELANQDVYSYTTSSSNGLNQTNVRLEERLLPSGKLIELIFVNDNLEGVLNYEGNYLTDLEIGATSVYYTYNESGYIDGLFEGEQMYEYFYNDDSLSQINLNEQTFVNVEYDSFDKVTQETYPNLSKRFKYSNSHKAEYIYNAEQDTEFLYQLTSLLDYNPYSNIETEEVVLNNQTYALITSITYEENTLQLEYNHIYNNKPYITKATYNDKIVEYAYVNDLLVCEMYDNVKITYIYSSTKQLVALMFSVEVEEHYDEILMPVVTDAFSNIIQINYFNVVGDGEATMVQNNVAMQATYNAFGQKSNYSNLENFDISLGYKSLLQFNEFYLNYENGNLYSTLNGISLSDASNLSPRQYEPMVKIKNTIQEATLIHSLMVENVQKYLYETEGASTVDEAYLWQNNEIKYLIDTYIVPATIDPNNIGLNEYEIYNLYAQDDQVKLNRLHTILEEFDETSKVRFGEDQAGLLGTLNIRLQFIYQNKLYLVTQVEDGLLKYEAITNYTKSNYLENQNLINYDTNKYIQYFKSNLDLNNYFSDFNLTFGLQGVSEFNEHLQKIEYVDATYAELFTEQDYGDNTEVIERMIENTFSLNVPNFDPETEYLDIDDNGDFIVLPIPEDAKGEKIINYRNILRGAGLIAFGVFATVSAVLMAVPTCGGSVVVIGIVFKTVAIGAAVLGTIAGGLMIAHELQENGNFIVNEFFNGDSEKLYRFGQIALTISGVANLAGGVLNKYAMCFVEGTLVTVKGGKKPIEQIKVGDYVLSYNEQTNEQSYQKVTNTFIRTVDELIEIEYNNNKIVTTSEHPFYVNGGWVEAKNLTVGTLLTLSNNKTVAVTSVKTTYQTATNVYNFEVENNHTYYVADGVLVHNACSAQDILDKADDIIKDPKYAKALEYVDELDNAGKLSKNWTTVKQTIWKAYGKSLNAADDQFFRITNLDDVISKGSSPIVKLFNANGKVIGTQRIDLHHVYGKLNPNIAGTMYKVVPMQWKNHIALHVKFTYQFQKFYYSGNFEELIKVVFKVR